MKTSVRMIEHKDLGVVEQLCRKMYAESISKYGVTFNLDIFTALIPQCMKSTFVLVNDKEEVVGVVVLQVNKGIGSNELIATELIWYVDIINRGNGKELLTFAEEWCMVNDVGMLILTHMGNLNTRLGRIYGRMGYEPLQTSYSKTFK